MMAGSLRSDGKKVCDDAMMARALILAKRGQYTCMPNPVVGCVIAKNGIIVGEGWHHKVGGPHAEVNALARAGEKSRGATAYVTLEPCSHYGRTPPCVTALITAGITRVVYGMTDPNPKVYGQGLNILQQAGLVVEGPLFSAQSQPLIQGFVKRQQQGMPKVTVKLAMSLDGRTAMASGESQWITGIAARQDVQRLRARSCAIVTGVGTVLHDDPSLTVRASELGLDGRANPIEIAARQPLRVVIDSQLRTPREAKVLKPKLAENTGLSTDTKNFIQGATLIVTANNELQCERAETICLAASTGQVDLSSVLALLAKRECNNVLVEAGAKLAGAFFQAGLVDEFMLYMAPKLLGSSARPLLSLPLNNMDQQIELAITDIRRIGEDIRITATPIL